MPHLTATLTDMHCRKTEDTGICGTKDELYIAGAVVAGTTSRALLTGILDLDNGQTSRFAPQDALLFDGDVPDGSLVQFVLRVFDQHSGADWQNRRAVVDRAQAELDRRLRERRPPGGDGVARVHLDEVARWLGDAFPFIAEFGRDDLLGQLDLDVPVANRVEAQKEIRSFAATRFAADYSIGYEHFIYRDGLTRADADAAWQRRVDEVAVRRCRRSRAGSRYWHRWTASLSTDVVSGRLVCS